MDSNQNKKRNVTERKENKEKTEKIEKTKNTSDTKKIHDSKDKTVLALTALKIILPVIACIIVITAIVSLVRVRGSKVSNIEANTERVSAESGESTLPDEPLAENAYPEVNELMQKFYKALADGDIDTVKILKDYTDDTEIITYQKKSEFIESYNNITCYTKNGTEPNTYFVYVSYDVKFNDIETTAPGLNAWYVYTSEDGTLKIDGDMDESVTATLKLVTSQDDVVDLYNKVDVQYKEAISSDENLNTFLTELPEKIKTSVGVVLAQLETQSSEADTDEVTSEETSTEVAEPAQSQTVNQKVRTISTVNVRSSDSEEADKIGKAEEGTELTRVEEKINGWSKVIYDGKEAYIKSDFLEVVAGEEGDAVAANTENNEAENNETSNDDSNSNEISTSGKTVKAKTNVTVRNAASKSADAIGTAKEGDSYKVLGTEGEWYKIEYNGQPGYAKAEYFE